MPTRLQYQDATIDAFGDEFLVECPRCKQHAIVRDRGHCVQPRVIVNCEFCGYSQFWQSMTTSILSAGNQQQYTLGQISIGDAVDWYFHLPLWLQTPCCGQTLWAYNRNHLLFIEDYIQAGLRERKREQSGWSNRSLRSRLPKWMQAASNRKAVLRAIEKLKQKAHFS